MNLSRDEICRTVPLFEYNNIFGFNNDLPPYHISDSTYDAIVSMYLKERNDKIIKQNEEKKRKGLFEMMVSSQLNIE